MHKNKRKWANNTVWFVGWDQEVWEGRGGNKTVYGSSSLQLPTSKLYLPTSSAECKTANCQALRERVHVGKFLPKKPNF